MAEAKWEYAVFYVASYPGAIDLLNVAGQDGWELATAVNGYFYLKRNVVEPEMREPTKQLETKKTKPGRKAIKK
jgi:hypothetical protein